MSETTINLIKAMLDNEEVYREANVEYWETNPEEAKGHSDAVALAKEVLQDVRNAIKEFNEFCTPAGKGPIGTVTVDVQVEGVEDAIKKMDRLIEKLQEAEKLAEGLACLPHIGGYGVTK